MLCREQISNVFFLFFSVLFYSYSTRMVWIIWHQLYTVIDLRLLICRQSRWGKRGSVDQRSQHHWNAYSLLSSNYAVIIFKIITWQDLRRRKVLVASPRNKVCPRQSCFQELVKGLSLVVTFNFVRHLSTSHRKESTSPWEGLIIIIRALSTRGRGHGSATPVQKNSQEEAVNKFYVSPFFLWRRPCPGIWAFRLASKPTWVMEEKELSRPGFECRLSALELSIENILNIVENVLSENRDREARILRRMDNLSAALNGFAESQDGIRDSCSCRLARLTKSSPGPASSSSKNKTKTKSSRQFLPSLSSSLASSHLPILVVGFAQLRTPRARPAPHLQVAVTIVPSSTTRRHHLPNSPTLLTMTTHSNSWRQANLAQRGQCCSLATSPHPPQMSL